MPRLSLPHITSCWLAFLCLLTLVPRSQAQLLWNVEVVDDAVNDDEGHSSIAVASDGTVHIAYQDAMNGDLKYARRSGTSWLVETVFDGGFLRYPSITLDASDNPHISFSDNVAPPNDIVGHARKTGGTWTTDVVSLALNALHTSIAIDNLGALHIAYNDDALVYARKLATGWTIETVDDSGDWLSLVMDRQNRPHVSYRDDDRDALMYAEKRSLAWAIMPVEDSSTEAFGRYSSLEVDRDFVAYISYYETYSADLKYARRTDAMTTWTIEIVDGVGLRGGFSSLEMDASNRPSISYWDQSLGDLRYARRPESGWQTQTVDGGDGVVGQWTSLALDAQGRAHISYFDQTGGALRYAVARSSSIREASTKAESPVDPTTVAATGGEPQLTIVPNPPSLDGDIRYALSSPVGASLTLYDVTGRRLCQHELPASQGALPWRLLARDGRVAPGTYFLRLTSSHGDQVTERVTIVR